MGCGGRTCAQYLNALISSDEFEELDWETYAQLIRNSLGWKEGNAGPTHFSVKIGEVVARTNMVRSLENEVLAAPVGKVKFGGQMVKADSVTLSPEDLRITCIYTSDDIENVDTYIGVSNLRSSLVDSGLCQDKAGKVYEGSPTRVTIYTYNGFDYPIISSSASTFTFNPKTGLPVEFNARFCGPYKGTKLKSNGYYSFHFDENGNLEKWKRNEHYHCPNHPGSENEL